MIYGQDRALAKTCSQCSYSTCDVKAACGCSWQSIFNPLSLDAGRSNKFVMGGVTDVFTFLLHELPFTDTYKGMIIGLLLSSN